MVLNPVLLTQNHITNNELEGIAIDSNGTIQAQTPDEGSILYSLDNNLNITNTRTFGNDWSDDIGFNHDSNTLIYQLGVLEMYDYNGTKIQSLNPYDAQGSDSQSWEGVSDLRDGIVFLAEESGDIYRFNTIENKLDLIKEQNADLGLVTSLSQYGSVSVIGYDTGNVYFFDSKTGNEQTSSITLSGAGALEDIAIKDANTIIAAYGTGNVARWETAIPIPEPNSFGIIALALGIALYKKFKR